REIANVMRKVVKKIAEGEDGVYTITPALIPKYLGVPRYENESEEKKDLIGVTKGLAWTESGGDIIHIEATLMKGKGVLTLTGRLQASRWRRPWPPLLRIPPSVTTSQ